LSHSYHDRVEMEPGPNDVALAAAVGRRRPVVVAGDYGKGCCVACGPLPGVEGPVSKEVPVVGTEREVRACEPSS